MKKGKLVLSKLINLILLLMAAFILIMFAYFLKDKMKEFFEAMFNVL